MSVELRADGGASVDSDGLYSIETNASGENYLKRQFPRSALVWVQMCFSVKKPPMPGTGVHIFLWYPE